MNNIELVQALMVKLNTLSLTSVKDWETGIAMAQGLLALKKNLEDAEKAKQKAEEAYNAALMNVTEKQNRLNELNAQRDSINIAIDVINDGLKYIFFSNNRMQIQVNDGVYKLLSNGHAVKPNDVSVG